MPDSRSLPEEPDIGTGEKTPGQIDTEKMIEQVKDHAKPAPQEKGTQPSPPADSQS